MATDIHTPLVVPEVRPAAPRPSPVATRLSIALAVVTAVVAALTAFLPDVLRGPDVMNGSARGTAMVLLFATVPVLVFGMRATMRGSTRGLLVWLGAIAHVLYQSVLMLFATPFNDLFLLYVSMFGLAIWSLVALLVGVDAEGIRARISPSLPRKPIAIFVWVIVTGNVLVWLGPVATAMREGSPAFLEGTGMTTNPIYVQDLAFWLPMMAVAAWWLWRQRAWGFVLIGSMLVMWLLEGVTVAVDQWVGHRADPTSSVATLGGAWLFAALAVVTVVPLVAFFRRVDAGAPPAPPPAR
jgi:hypothetical protein